MTEGSATAEESIHNLVKELIVILSREFASVAARGTDTTEGRPDQPANLQAKGGKIGEVRGRRLSSARAPARHCRSKGHEIPERLWGLTFAGCP